MWSRKKPDAPRTAKPEPKDLQANQPSRPASTTVEGTTQIRKEARLGPSLQMKGEITGSEDLVIDGSFEGIVQLNERSLIVGTTGNVTADIIAGEVVVYGSVKGNVRAKNRIEIKKDGSVTGNLTTPQILIEDGAFFKGSIEIGRNVEKEVPKNAFSQTPPASNPPKAAA
jgi:cytoskeletal protein CcmA (bactofilin family)